jgi:hypothetical protein
LSKPWRLAKALGVKFRVPQPFTFFVKGAGLAGVTQNYVDTNFVTHHIRVMKAKLRNINVMLDEQVARWARMEAARKETSVSRLLGEILRERMLDKDGYEAAMRRALARKAFLKTDGQYLSHEKAHGRARHR